jgi:hypothetical protein
MAGSYPAGAATCRQSTCSSSSSYSSCRQRSSSQLLLLGVDVLLLLPLHPARPPPLLAMVLLLVLSERTGLVFVLFIQSRQKWTSDVLLAPTPVPWPLHPALPPPLPHGPSPWSCLSCRSERGLSLSLSLSCERSLPLSSSLSERGTNESNEQQIMNSIDLNLSYWSSSSTENT